MPQRDFACPCGPAGHVDIAPRSYQSIAMVPPQHWTDAACRVPPPSIFVVGPEGSGTTLLWDCVARHPELQTMRARAAPEATGPMPADGVILHLSLPTLRPMRWVGGWAVPRGARVLLLRRSPVHTVFSAYRRFYRRPQPAWRTYFRAVALEASWLARHEPLCVAYEELVIHSAAVLRRVYEFLGVDGGFAPPIAIADRNDDRWRDDARFAAFMQRAFGVGRPPPSSADAGVSMARLDFRYHGTRIAIADASGAGVADALRAALPPDLEPPGDAAPDAQYRVERRTGLAGVTSYRVVAGGDLRLRTPDPMRAVDWLRTEIDAAIAERSRQALFVHAGVVGWRGHAIVVPGRTMSGKSRLVTELVRCGATYYSDEFAVFDAEGRVLPYARQTMLRDSGVEVDLGRRDAVAALPVGLIVSTRYRAGAAWQPQALRGVRAVVPIIDNTILARREARQLLQLSAKIAPRAVTLQGPRPDAAEVAPRLLAYLDDLLAGSAPPAPRAGGAAVLERAQAALDAASPPDEILPPRYVRVDGLLDAHEHARLLAYARGRAADFAASGVIDHAGSRRIDEQFRRSATLHDLAEVWGLFEARLRRWLPHVRRELAMAWFPLGQIERQMTVHRQGDFFGRHNDDGTAAIADRRLTCVYYFHGQPRRFAGGELKIYERLVRGGRVTAGPEHVTLEPADNSAVFFASSAPHEVCPVAQTSADFADSRFSITVWFRLGPPPRCLEAPSAAVATPPS